MDNYAWILIIVMVIGLFGTFAPLVPGLWLMSGALLVYGIFDGWQTYSIWFLVIAVVLTLISSFFDLGGSMIGAKKFGASVMAPIGTVVGTALGGFFASLPGALIGGILGTIIAEVYHKRSLSPALRATAGSLVGMAVSSLLQFSIGFIILIYTVYRLWEVA